MEDKGKQLNLFWTMTLAIGVFIAIFASCTPESFVKPRLMQDESDVAGHSEWRRAVFRFREGHTHGPVFHGHPMPIEYKEVKYMKTYQEIELEWEVKDGKKTLSRSYSGPIRFEPKTWYAFEILYYDKNDSLMNYQFTSTPELAKVHQHFMIPTKGKDIETGESISDEELKSALSFSYRDTEPSDYVRKEEEDNTHLRDEHDPMGFKGYFFEARGGISYDLKVKLVHILKGDKRSSSGRSYPFNDPATRLMGAYDMEVTVPIRVYTKFGMDGYFEDEILENDVAREFNLSKKAAKKEIKAKYYGGVDKHGSDYYL